MQCGYFDDLNREYVITDPCTPVKWINYIGTRDFGGFVDHTGGALLCKEDPTYNRITKYIQQLPAADFRGETLYIRLHTRCGYDLYSPFFTPVLKPLDQYRCHVGLGYNRIYTEYHGIQAEVNIFVPQGEKREIRDIRITNLTGEAQTLDVIPVLEYSHPDALKQFTNADWVPQTMQSKAVLVEPFTVLIQYPFMYRDTRINIVTSNLPASSFETDRKVFLGMNEYGSFQHPLSLEQEELTNSQANRGDNLAVLLHKFQNIQPGETRRLILQVTQARNLDEALEGIEAYRNPAVVDQAFEQLKSNWARYLDTMQVVTPDDSMNSMLNIHNPRQCYVTKTWSRYLSTYQVGLGARGIGIRDSSQDVMGVTALDPIGTREFLGTLLRFQKKAGWAVHQFNPLTMEGSCGDAAEMEDRPKYYSDDHLWLILAVCTFLKETGDLSFLEEAIPFYEFDKTGAHLEIGTVLDHLKTGLAFSRGDLGNHGLPLLGYADWNDTVNLPTGAESVFTANLYGKALLEMIDLMVFQGDIKAAEAYRIDYQDMKEKVNRFAWDGQWYVRYFDAEGCPIGSSQNKYGQIYLNGQTWPVISGFATPERARQALESVYTKMNTRCGLKLTFPGFDGYDPHYGGITTYPPGAKENGGIFLHPNPWAMIAEAIMGNGNRAYRYYQQINPFNHNESIETYEVEPYVYAQNILGDEHPQFGLGRNSWLSGTATWCYQAGTQWILGIRPEYGGLRIDPCIPSEWRNFEVVRQFRQHRYLIKVHNPIGVCRGVVRMTVDGREIDGNLITLDDPGADHRVEAWLG